jgi:hypothetical protein
MGQLHAVNLLTGGYFKDLDTEFPGIRKALYSQMHASTGHHFSRSDTPSTTSSYTPTPPLVTPVPGELPFVNGFILNQQPETTRTEALSSATVTTQALYAHSYPITTHPGIGASIIHESGVGGGGQDQEQDPNLYYSEQDFYTSWYSFEHPLSFQNWFFAASERAGWMLCRWNVDK